MTGELRLRYAARALILDEHDHVLLVCFPTAAEMVWATPGGGLEPGESPVEGLARELHEELGVTDLEVGPHIWNRTAIFPVSSEYDGQHNRIFLVRTQRFEPNPMIGWDGMRDEGVSEIRWWSLDDIERAPTGHRFVPSGLVRLTRDLVVGGAPPAPLET